MLRHSGRVYLVQQEVGVDFVCSHVGETTRARLLVYQVHCNALETEGMATVGDKRVPDHTHTYWAGEVFLSQSEQLSSSQTGLGTRRGTTGELLRR